MISRPHARTAPREAELALCCELSVLAASPPASLPPDDCLAGALSTRCVASREPVADRFRARGPQSGRGGEAMRDQAAGRGGRCAPCAGGARGRRSRPPGRNGPADVPQSRLCASIVPETFASAAECGPGRRAAARLHIQASDLGPRALGAPPASPPRYKSVAGQV
ncbi:hypothetical protein B0H15DRAFT_157295 [Mycena belliarum]|uniref:Uncharacterized protein n=1 Tax=Mycena belliarum TaxID=1033014 RepID=A0AAD6UCV0_9AGAR|nr:hypothetical protein B0H15DRAFT_157295 [Mycena belliae]